MKDNNLLQLFLMCMNNRRHMQLSICAFIQIQIYKSDLMALCKTVNLCILFKINNKAEIKPVYELILDMTYNQFIELLNYCFDRPHEHLVIDQDNNLSF